MGIGYIQVFRQYPNVLYLDFVKVFDKVRGNFIKSDMLKMEFGSKMGDIIYLLTQHLEPIV